MQGTPLSQNPTELTSRTRTQPHAITHPDTRHTCAHSLTASILRYANHTHPPPPTPEDGARPLPARPLPPSSGGKRSGLRSPALRADLGCCSSQARTACFYSHATGIQSCSQCRLGQGMQNHVSAHPRSSQSPYLVDAGLGIQEKQLYGGVVL